MKIDEKFFGKRSNLENFPQSLKISENRGKSETGGKMHHCLMQGDGRPCIWVCLFRSSID